MMRVMIMLLTVAVLAACAGADSGASPSGDAKSSRRTSPGQPPPSSSSTSTPPPSSTVPPPTATPPTAPPKTPTDQFVPIEVTGTVSREPGKDCVVLTTPTNVRYLLVGAAATALAAGDEARVRGLPAPQYNSGCTGNPLKVREITRL